MECMFHSGALAPVLDAGRYSYVSDPRGHFFITSLWLQVDAPRCAGRLHGETPVLHGPGASVLLLLRLLQ